MFALYLSVQRKVEIETVMLGPSSKWNIGQGRD